MKLLLLIVAVAALNGFVLACDLFDVQQDCSAFDAAPILSDVCSGPAEAPHFLWFQGWTNLPFIDQRLIVDPNRQNLPQPVGLGQFVRDASGNTLLQAALCSALNCAQIKFDFSLSLTGYQQPPVTGWNGNYPITGGGVSGFPAAPTTPKTDLLNTGLEAGNCQCLHPADCPPSEQPNLAADCWEFYTSPTLTQAQGFLTGVPGTLTDGINIEITLFQRTGTQDYRLSPQRGFGANDKNDKDGFAMWFNWRVVSQGTNAAFQLPLGSAGWSTSFNFDTAFHGDVNVQLNCAPAVIVVCVDLVDGFDCPKAHEDVTGPCIEVVTSTSVFRATGDHLIHTPRDGWRLVRELKVGDLLRSGIIESISNTVCKSLNSCITDNQRFDAYGEVFAQNGLVTPDNYQEMLIE